MQESLAAMQTAIRVLAAITERRHPNPADLDQLRQFKANAESMSPDELACEVIREGINDENGYANRETTSMGPVLV